MTHKVIMVAAALSLRYEYRYNYASLNFPKLQSLILYLLLDTIMYVLSIIVLFLFPGCMCIDNIPTFQWCQADGKEHSITTKFVLRVI